MELDNSHNPMPTKSLRHGFRTVGIIGKQAIEVLNWNSSMCRDLICQSS